MLYLLASWRYKGLARHILTAGLPSPVGWKLARPIAQPGPSRAKLLANHSFIFSCRAQSSPFRQASYKQHLTSLPTDGPGRKDTFNSRILETGQLRFREAASKENQDLNPESLGLNLLPTSLKKKKNPFSLERFPDFLYSFLFYSSFIEFTYIKSNWLN